MYRIPVSDNTLSDRKIFAGKELFMKKGYRGLIKNKINFRLLVWICAALGWWGIIYPEFTLTSDTCRIVDKDGNYVEMDACLSGIELYEDILQAGRDNIRPRSRILSAIMELSEKQDMQADGREQE